VSLGTESITRRLAYFEGSDIMDELSRNIRERRRLDYTLNLLGGMLEESLPYYFLPDLPHHHRLNRQKKALKSAALRLLEKDIGEIFLFLLDENVEEEARRYLFFLVAKNLVKTALSFKEYLLFAAVMTELASSKDLAPIARQGLCRYDLEPLGESSGIDEIDCSKKLPYPELLKALSNPADPYKKQYLLLTKQARILYASSHEDLPEFDEPLIEGLLKGLPLKNLYATLLAMKKAASRPHPLKNFNKMDLKKGDMQREAFLHSKIKKDCG